MPDHRPPSAGRVAGKVAFVTGAASGIGRATTVLLANQGAAVYCADLNRDGAEEAAAALIAAGRSAWSCHLDVTSEPSWQTALAQVVQAQGRLDIAVNCAGIASSCPLVDLSLEDWRRVLAVNLEGVFLGTKHALRVMRQEARSGSIVNVSSVSGIKAQPGASAYCTSKAGVLMLTKPAALECLRHGDKIRVNAVSPSGVKMPM